MVYSDFSNYVLAPESLESSENRMIIMQAKTKHIAKKQNKVM